VERSGTGVVFNAFEINIFGDDKEIVLARKVPDVGHLVDFLTGLKRR
jgi:hypothetical protein